MLLQGSGANLVGCAEIDRRQATAEQQGDIIVTEESAKKMARPPAAKGTPTAAKKGAAGTTAGTPAAPAPDTPAPATDSTGAAGDKPIRSVGPTFIPKR